MLTSSPLCKSIGYFVYRDLGSSTLWVKEHLFAFKWFSRNERFFALLVPNYPLHVVLLGNSVALSLTGFDLPCLICFFEFFSFPFSAGVNFVLVLPSPWYCNLLLMHRKLCHWPHTCRLPHSALAHCLWLPLCIICTALATLAIIQQGQWAPTVMVTSASCLLIYFVLDWHYRFV